MKGSKRPTKQHRRLRPSTSGVAITLATIFAWTTTTTSRIPSVEAFGVVPPSAARPTCNRQSPASSPLQAAAEDISSGDAALNGAKAAVEPPIDLEEVYAPPEPTERDEELESRIETTIITEETPVSALVSDNNSNSSSSLPVEHAFAPHLTYKKFLTMQVSREKSV